MRTLAQTGNGWMAPKDKSNQACNQTALPGRTVHRSNLCTEILEVTSQGRDGGLQLKGRSTCRATLIVEEDRRVAFDFDKLACTVRAAIRQLDRVIDLNFYPIGAAAASNQRWRPVGLGVMGLADVFFQMRPSTTGRSRGAACALSARISEEILTSIASPASAELADEKGAHLSFLRSSGAARGRPQFAAWVWPLRNGARWASGCAIGSSRAGCATRLWWRSRSTATIASIAGCTGVHRAVQISNLFPARDAGSGDFPQVNRHLVAGSQGP